MAQLAAELDALLSETMADYGVSISLRNSFSPSQATALRFATAWLEINPALPITMEQLIEIADAELKDEASRHRVHFAIQWLFEGMFSRVKELGDAAATILVEPALGLARRATFLVEMADRDGDQSSLKDVAIQYAMIFDPDLGQ